jgi:hypothetical protein
MTSGCEQCRSVGRPNADGTIGTSSGVNHGFVRRRSGAITTFNVPAAGTSSGQGTIPEGIDLWGGITGNHIDSSGANHGFVRNRFGAITTFDAPGAGTASGQGTIPATPNMFGAITGQYIDQTTCITASCGPRSPLCSEQVST